MGATADSMPSLSIFFFAYSDSGPAPARYDFVLRAAALAEELGFAAVWLPERHFHPFGGLFPNPAVVAAALATRTERIALRAGSVVLPLHHVARVAEEWAVVDALSNGRAGVSLASGWNSVDFLLGACAFEDRREHTLTMVDALRGLWRGEEISFPAEDGAAAVRTYPVPQRRRLPLWLTATSGTAAFEEAGRRGLGVLTAYLQQGRQQLVDNISTYRARFAAHSAGDPEPHVTLMMHAYVASTRRDALAAVTEPLTAYQGQFLDLQARGHDPAAPLELTDEEKRQLARYAARKYATERGLVGDRAWAAERLRHLRSIGVDEVACLVDFGLTEDQVKATLVALAEVAGLPR